MAAQATLVRVEISERSAILGGKAFGKAGAYERLIGKAYFAVDPAAEANRDVVNLALAPRNASGQVEFYADFVLFAPVDPKKSNGTLFFEVSNRGRKGLLSAFSHAQGSNDPRTAAEFGDALLLEQGFTLAWLGWQFDAAGAAIDVCDGAGGEEAGRDADTGGGAVGLCAGCGDHFVFARRPAVFSVSGGRSERPDGDVD